MMMIRDLPVEQPQERMQCFGAGHLSDCELLAMVIRKGTDGLSALDVSRNLLIQFGGLRGIVGREATELSGVPGIGPTKANQIQAIAEISRRLEAPDPEKISFGSSTDVAQYYMPLFAHVRHEVFTVLMLDARNRLIREQRVSEGSLTASVVHPREVFRLAIIESAASVIFLHNHPSGDPTPSQDDLRITTQLVDAGRLIDIRVLDHIILGYKQFTSLATKGII